MSNLSLQWGKKAAEIYKEGKFIESNVSKQVAVRVMEHLLHSSSMKHT